MAILVIGEHDNSTLRPSTLNTVTAAAALGTEVDLLIAGADCSSVTDEASKVGSVSRVLVADDLPAAVPAVEGAEAIPALASCAATGRALQRWPRGTGGGHLG